MTARRSVAVTIPDRTAPLPAHLPAGTRVRLGTGSREIGTVIRGERDQGGVYVVVHVDRTGALRCRPATTLVPLRRRRRSRS
ncbi:MAG: hypothetical protein ACYCTL_13300 [Acidimicrobiales bacterium]